MNSFVFVLFGITTFVSVSYFVCPTNTLKIISSLLEQIIASFLCTVTRLNFFFFFKNEVKGAPGWLSRLRV